VNGINWPLAVSVISVLVSAGLLRWALRANQALQYAELDKRYATHASVTQAHDSMRQTVNGARQAMKRDLAELEKRVEQSDAKSALAVQNADTALHEAQETRTLLEHYHDRIEDDFARPVERLSGVLAKLSENVAAQGAVLRMIAKIPPTNEDE
jgi:biopolymer transport protein ExbB/TolQ